MHILEIFMGSLHKAKVNFAVALTALLFSVTLYYVPQFFGAQRFTGRFFGYIWASFHLLAAMFYFLKSRNEVEP